MSSASDGIDIKFGMEVRVPGAKKIAQYEYKQQHEQGPEFGVGDERCGQREFGEVRTVETALLPLGFEGL